MLNKVVFRFFAFVVLGVTSALGQGAPSIHWSTNAHASGVRAVAASTNGLLASGANDGRVKIWRASDGALVHTITNHTTSVDTLAFSPDGGLLAISAASAFAHETSLIKIWRVSDWQEYRSISNGCWAIAFSPDGSLLAAAPAGEYSNLILYRVSDGNIVRQTPIAQTGYDWLAFSPDGELLVADNFYAATLHVFAVSDLSERRYISKSAGSMFSYAPDAKTVALPGSDGSLGGVIQIADPQTGTIRTGFRGHTEPVRAVVHVANGKGLVSAGKDNTIRVWRVANQRAIALYDQGTTRVRSLVALPDGRRFAYGREDGTLVVARVPLHLAGVRRQASDVVVEWEGGAGPYQLQKRASLADGPWQNVDEPTAATSATNPASSTGFYGVIDLGSQ